MSGRGAGCEYGRSARCLGNSGVYSPLHPRSVLKRGLGPGVRARQLDGGVAASEMPSGWRPLVVRRAVTRDLHCRTGGGPCLRRPDFVSFRRCALHRTSTFAARSQLCAHSVHCAHETCLTKWKAAVKSLFEKAVPQGTEQRQRHEFIN
ncbi:hypothetical protein FKP32DRAFT_442233 [Trametes sanguinea]|nr:hypothetical protein FKP32DRAFT_442233 [Trametes sanguinea]